MPRIALGPSARIVRRRAANDPFALLGAVVTVILAASAAAIGPVYSAAVADSGVRRVVAEAPVRSVGIQVTGKYDPAAYGATSATVVQTLAGGLAGTNPAVYRSARSQSFELPDQPAGPVPRLAVLGFADRLADEGELVTGTWPGPATAGDSVDAAVSQQVAGTLGLAPGETLRMRPRLGGRTISVRVAGIYALRDPRSVMWWGNPLETRGLEVQSFSSYGPFYVHEESFARLLGARGATAYWRAGIDKNAVRAGQLGAVAATAAGVAPTLKSVLPAANLSIDTRLPELLLPADRSLLVGRGATYVPTAQLMVLAAYALLLAAALVRETRHVETALLRARGATAGQVGVVALIEAAAVVVPATVLGPLLAALSVRVLNQLGPLADLGLRLRPRIGPDAFVAAGSTALLCSTALVVPAVLGARTFAAARRDRGRARRFSLLSHLRLDLAAIVVGALLLWQVRRYGSGLTQTTGGELRVDPLLVAGPAAGLMAGSLLMLRLLPVISAAADRWAARQPGLAGPLAAWQLSRRPARYTGPAVLLVLALAIGVFSVTFSASWRTSQRDQADFALGSDVRVSRDTRTQPNVIDVAGSQEALAGVRRSMAVVRDTINVSARQSADVVAVDATDLGAVMRLRPGLSESSVGALATALTSRRALPPAVPLPGRPRRLRLDGGPGNEAISLSVVVRDAGGVLHRLAAAAGQGGQVIELSTGAARYPLALAAVEVDVPARLRYELAADISVESSDMPVGDAWQPVDAGGRTWTGSSIPPLRPGEPGADRFSAQDGKLVVRLAAPHDDPPPARRTTFRLLPETAGTAGPVAAVVSDNVLALTRRNVGDVVSMELGGARRDVEFVGAVRFAPTLARDRPAVIVDMATLAALRYAEGGTVLTPAEWWVSTEPGAVQRVAAALAIAGGGAWDVRDRLTERSRISRDDAGVGLVGGLAIALAGAGLLAAVGFAAGLAAGIRQRLPDVAVLRALGAPPRHVAGALGAEQALIVTTSVLGGMLVGLVLAKVVVPAFVLTSTGAAVVPDVRVVVPWSAVILLCAVLAAVTLAVVAAAAGAVRAALVGPMPRMEGDA